MTKLQINSMVARIEHHKKAVAKHRDSLREIQDELQGLDESFTEGLESLESAIASFSELV